MAKSSKKQCRKPKPPRQSGGMVVVSARMLQAKTAKPDASSVTKRNKVKKKRQVDVFEEMKDSRDEWGSEDSSSCHAPSRGVSSPTLNAHYRYLFASVHTREQRLYYLLATRSPTGVATGAIEASTQEGGCHALVFVETVAAAQEIVADLKALNMAAFAVHERTPKAQAHDHMKRFVAASPEERSSVLVLTNATVARSLSVGPIPVVGGVILRVVHFDAAAGTKNAAARERVVQNACSGRDMATMQEIYMEEAGNAAALAPFAFESGAMGAIRSRLAAAKKLSKVIAKSVGGAESYSMERAAAAAGLAWVNDDRKSESGADSVQREKRRVQAQQATAIREKISVLLCQPLLVPNGPRMAASGTPARPQTQLSSKEIRKKMVVLGMIHGPQGAADAGVKAGMPEDRAVAKTRWLDGSAGTSFGWSWGNVRTGASCDSASLDMRARVEKAKQAVARHGTGGKSGASKRRKRGPDEVTAFAKWEPNPDTPDPERWGGRWGKPCGHNEVVLHHVRPFAPMEVINTRVCSRFSPAPGNTGFDGCMELLSLACREHKRALTAWDDASFLYIDKAGVCSTLQKQTMLHLTLPSLRFLMKNMRSSTVCCQGQTPPREVARTVIRCVGWGAKNSTFGPLTTELSSRIMSFVLSGDPASWRSVAAGLGVRGAEAGAGADGKTRNKSDTLAFASKKKRKNFNL